MWNYLELQGRARVIDRYQFAAPELGLMRCYLPQNETLGLTGRRILYNLNVV